MSQAPDTASQGDLVAQWNEATGKPLEKALSSIRTWALEGNPSAPRTVSFLEFKARVEGWLTFDGNCYKVADGWAKCLVGLATSLEANGIPVLGSTAAYDLAVRIAVQNNQVGEDLPDCLKRFLPGSGDCPERPRGVGDDSERRSFRNMLAWWGVQRGVDLGLHPEKNREKGVFNPREKKFPSACELVTEAFRKAGWTEVTYNMVVTAWQPHRYGGHLDQRKLAKKSNVAAYHKQFLVLDRLIAKLSSVNA